MSMITSCPTCGTMFRVVADQLKISEGWVRCGHCAEVFDASAHLADESILEPLMPAAPAPSPAPAARPVPAARATPTPPPAPLPPSEAPTRPAELHTRPAELYQTRSAERSTESSSFFAEEAEALEPSPLDAPFVFRPSDLAQPDRDSSILPPVPAERPEEDEDEDELPPAALKEVSFVRNARRKAFWRRPLVRVGLALVSLALAAALLLQVAYQDRDRLALAQPQLRPALLQMCEWLQCTLGAPRQIEAIVIESSGFNRLRNDTYRLAFTLRNTAPVQVAVPAIELTVTDGEDQPIARRVLLPQELGAGDGAIAAGGEWSRAAGIVLEAPATARVAGYRLLAFYP